MSKLNPQNATAYVGPGVLRKGGKITKVPNGPLVKKKGPFKGSTLKTGGRIKKAANGTTTTAQTTAPPTTTPPVKKLTPQEARKKLDSITAINRAENVRKKDSILERNLKATGLTRKQYQAKQEADKNKPDAVSQNNSSEKETKSGCPPISKAAKARNKNGGPIKKAQMGGMMAMFGGKDNPIYKKTTDLRGKLGGAALGMPGMKPIVKNGKMIKRADGSKSRHGLWDSIRENKGSGKKPTKQMLAQEKKIKAKTKK
jgi:hypothetical protein